jgi:hypothetical protein
MPYHSVMALRTMPYRLGRYEVLLPLGQRARLGFSDELDRWLVYRPLDGGASAARRAIGLVHPHVVEALDVIEDEGEVLDVVEYAPGATLSELGAISPAVALRVVKDALVGLERWHSAIGAHGHLDAKTILVGTDGVSRIMRRSPNATGTPQADIAKLLDLLTGEIDPAVRDVCTQRAGSAGEIADALEQAARPTRSMADAAEVAALVGRSVASKLRARRELVAQAAKERAERPQSLPDVRTLVAGGGPPPTKRPPLPPLPDKPTPRDDRASELHIFVPTDRNAERASVKILGTATEIPEEEPSVVRSPLAIGDPQAAQKRLALIAGGIGLAIGFVLVLVVVTRKHEPEDAKTAMTITSGTAAPTAQVPAPTEAPEVPTLLQVSANAPISSLQLGKRAVESGAPAATMSVELTEDEVGQPLHVVVTSTDGRTATANANPGELEVNVTFGARPKPHAPAGTTKRTWSKHK